MSNNIFALETLKNNKTLYFHIKIFKTAYKNQPTLTKPSSPNKALHKTTKFRQKTVENPSKNETIRRKSKESSGDGERRTELAPKSKVKSVQWTAIVTDRRRAANCEQHRRG